MIRSKLSLTSISRIPFPSLILNLFKTTPNNSDNKCPLSFCVSDCETPSRIKKFFFSCHNSNNLNGTLLLSDGTIEDWKAMLDVNVLALCVCTREAIKSMERHEIDGQIIHINAIAGQIPNVSQFSVYPATKNAVVGLAGYLRKELLVRGSRIKVSVREFIRKGRKLTE